MRYLLLSVLPVVAGGCPTGANPDFCLQAGDDCGVDRVCNPNTKQCEDIAPSCEPGNHDQCNVDVFPFCSPDGACQRCSAADEDFCATLDPSRPVCRAEGDCVGCIDSADCGVDTPVCDKVNLTCVECADHGDCATGACDIQNQACIDEASIIRVDPMAGDDVECATTATPCQTITAALLQVVDSKQTIVLAAGTYPESVDISGDDVTVPVTIIGPLADPRATIDPPNTNVPGLLVQRGAVATVDGVVVSGATGGAAAYGVRCAQNGAGTPVLSLDRMTLANNQIRGLDASDCDVTLTRSIVTRNDQGGISVDRVSAFTITNNFIHNNGGAASAIGGVKLDTPDSPRQVFDFNTVVFNTAQGIGEQASGLFCISAVSGTGNIFHGGAGAPSLSSACSMTYSHIFLPNDMQPDGEGNVNVRDPLFLDTEDFHLMPGSELHNVSEFTADKVAAGVTVDIDGDPRPQGELLDIGADEVTE